MQKIIIEGGRPLDGSVSVAGAKNAVLPIMAAFLLAPGRSTLSRVPALRDVETMIELVRSLGVEIDRADHTVGLDATRLTGHEAPYRLVRKMRASFYVLGPLLARLGRAKVSLPGGCAWGPRPVDLHLKGLTALGAELEVDHGDVVARADRLRGAEFDFPISSVGATAHVLMAAVLAEGTTVLTNCAIEPEVSALAECLQAMGADIEGIGSTKLVIRGVDELRPVKFRNIADRIEAGTFLIAGAMTGGRVRVIDVNPDHLGSLVTTLREVGAKVEQGDDWIEARGNGLHGTELRTEVFPGFPTDLQAQMMALLAVAEGESRITETIYLDRFSHVDELRRLGADIAIEGASAIIRGQRRLEGATVRSTDLRASASLVLGGLVADGETHVTHVHHLDRGYEAIEDKFRALGARMRRADDPDALDEE